MEEVEVNVEACYRIQSPVTGKMSAAGGCHGPIGERTATLLVRLCRSHQVTETISSERLETLIYHRQGPIFPMWNVYILNTPPHV
ncbi:hypothetical protein RchiOBHm_Chr1g0352611 [Rosa chinensis]|uniref:Uncharacterized protein n=1 Tax=Rosa chinensis TaxID=74649 RepID=A0A2P6SGP0_ROSCH|nr:hypothetical protein RchiOBHm_Chr1g0352611 [Rosa chinensis]